MESTRRQSARLGQMMTGAQEQPARSHDSRAARCLSCSRRKVRCDMVFPCTHCFAYCLRCQPPPRDSDVPYVELAITRQNPRILTELLMQKFSRLRASNLVDRTAVLELLRLWSHQSAHARQDVTFGLLDLVRSSLGLGLIDLEAPEDVASARHPGAGPSPAADASLSARLSASGEFRALDVENSMLFMIHIREDGVAGVATNRGAAAGLMTASELWGYLSKCTFAHVIASMINPDDRELWCEMIWDMFARQLRTRTELIKLANKEGEIELYVVRTRTLLVSGTGGTRRTYVITFERAPPSRHLARREGHRHRVSDSFRVAAPPAARAPEDTHPGPTDRLPPLASIPLDPPPPKDLRAAALEPLPLPRTRPAAKPLHVRRVGSERRARAFEHRHGGGGRCASGCEAEWRGHGPAVVR